MSAGGETTRNKPTNPSKSDLLCIKNFAGCFSLSFEKGFRFSRPRPTVLYTYIDVFKLYLNAKRISLKRRGNIDEHAIDSNSDSSSYWSEKRALIDTFFLDDDG